MDLFSRDEEKGITFLSFDSNFLIDDRSQVIFAANGLCKTTICKAIEAAHPNSVLMYRYDDSADVSFKGKNNKYTIECNVTGLTAAEEGITQLSKQLNYREVIGQLLGVKKVGDASTIADDSLRALYTGKGQLEKVTKLSEEQRKGLRYILSSTNGVALLAKHLDDFKHVSALKEEDDALKDTYKIAIFDGVGDLESHKEDILERGCPLCGDTRSDVFDRIKEKAKELEKEKTLLFFQFDTFSSLPTSEKEPAMEETIDAVKSMTPDQLATLIFTSGSKEKEDAFEKAIGNYNEDCKTRDSLKEKRDGFYSAISLNKAYVRSNLFHYYPEANITFNDEEKTVDVTIGRKAEQYSEGENHDIYSTIKCLSFEGSDKNILIADDPLSSLDVINQYKIIFRFVRLAKDKGKKIILFTHNIDLLNMAKSQCPNVFSYRYVDVIGADPVTNNRVLSIFTIPEPAELAPVIALDDLEADPANGKYIKLLTHRGSDALRETSNHIFHYDASYAIDSAKVAANPSLAAFNGMSNDDLVKLIDDFVELKARSFYESTAEKIVYICALRVWIEKQFLDFANTLAEPKRQTLKTRLIGEMLQKKIGVIFSADYAGDFTAAYPKCKRENLMAQKTLINENMHPDGAIHPFNYAMCISIADINSEIRTIKGYFDLI
jgi:hypothetical protein